MEADLLEVMLAGLRDLEPHPFLVDPPNPSAFARFQTHFYVFSRRLDRLLERRIARNLDSERTSLIGMSRAHLSVHRPFTRGLERHLLERGISRSQLDAMEVGPDTLRLLEPVERALGLPDPLLAHVLLDQGLECLTQLLARRGVELAEELGTSPELFESRHDGHETLFFTGLDEVAAHPLTERALLFRRLRYLFADAKTMLLEWRERDVGMGPTRRIRRRSGPWRRHSEPEGGA